MTKAKKAKAKTASKADVKKKVKLHDLMIRVGVKWEGEEYPTTKEMFMPGLTYEEGLFIMAALDLAIRKVRPCVKGAHPLKKKGGKK